MTEDSELDFLTADRLDQTIITLEKAIQDKPDNLTNYWKLGLAYLLQEEEEAAQLVWLSAIAEHSSPDFDDVVHGLVQVLSLAAEKFRKLERWQNAWVIRQHIREFNPTDLSNLLALIEISVQLGTLTGEFIQDLHIVEILESGTQTEINNTIIQQALKQALTCPLPEIIDFSKACFPYFQDPKDWNNLIIAASVQTTNKQRFIHFSIALIELCLELDPTNQAALGYLPRLYIECQEFKKAVQAAKHFYQSFRKPDSRLFSSCLLLQALMRAGDWSEIPETATEVEHLIMDLVASNSNGLALNTIQFAIINASLFAYLYDDIEKNRRLQNKAARLFHENILSNAPTLIKSKYPIRENDSDRLKIGYIGSTFRLHSVGWLSRWLFKYHDRKNFDISLYLVKQPIQNHFFEEWFLPYIDRYKHLDGDIEAAVESIYADNLDILVDMDSLTLDYTCTLLAMNPAPIQATWLAGDASGSPAIDYFIADPYVLSDEAENYYQEKIWRLPETYIAVDGFEIGIPTIHRSDLEIPKDAVVFWSSQVGYKRNPEMIQLQMKILRGVPNSYFLIKGLGDQDIIEQSFKEIAHQVGVLPDRLRFLPLMPDEFTHRANLQIADVVLDTYPYNGATTTLETLWVGVPLVTRAGTTFSSRNSYAFLKNVGVHEGIAWTDEEYVEWGIRLGTDTMLRQEVAWKLRQARKTSPLWNAKKFTNDMEDAFRKMLVDNKG